jgi:nucleotide-binding universal stress UspA family protein
MNAVHAGRPVLVGVDGSEASLAAVDWAVSEAVTRDSWLQVVHAFIWPLFPHVPLGPSPYGPPAGGPLAACAPPPKESSTNPSNGRSKLRRD